MIPNPKSFNSWSAGSYGDILLIARDEDGVVVDLSDPDTIIVWAIADSENSSPLTSKSYPASGIAFVTDGSDGKFNVAMSGGRAPSELQSDGALPMRMGIYAPWYKYRVRVLAGNLAA